MTHNVKQIVKTQGENILEKSFCIILYPLKNMHIHRAIIKATVQYIHIKVNQFHQNFPILIIDSIVSWLWK